MVYKLFHKTSACGAVTLVSKSPTKTEITQIWHPLDLAT